MQNLKKMIVGSIILIASCQSLEQDNLNGVVASRYNNRQKGPKYKNRNFQKRDFSSNSISGSSRKLQKGPKFKNRQEYSQNKQRFNSTDTQELKGPKYKNKDWVK